VKRSLKHYVKAE
jgi:hypothetical protein